MRNSTRRVGPGTGGSYRLFGAPHGPRQVRTSLRDRRPACEGEAWTRLRGDGQRTTTHQHRDLGGGQARAAVFGVSDGLVSNMALILGVAGADASSSFVRVAGLAGMVAGAVSMAAGEYVSMKAQQRAARARADHGTRRAGAQPREGGRGAGRALREPGDGRRRGQAAVRARDEPARAGPRGPRPRGAGHRSRSRWVRRSVRRAGRSWRSPSAP